MVKGSHRGRPSVRALFAFSDTLFKEINMNKTAKTAKKQVIAYRKSCKAKGTGLSHYILPDKKAK
jgi:modified peptide precursor CbpA